MQDSELKKRITQSLQEGFSRTEIFRALENEGYDEERIERLFKEAEGEREKGEQELKSFREEGTKKPGMEDQNPEDENSEEKEISVKNGIKAGIKSGLVSGLLFGILTGGTIVAIGSQIGGILGFLAGMGGGMIFVGSITVGLISFFMAGLLLGVFYAVTYSYIPGSNDETKGLVLGAIAGIMNIPYMLQGGVSLFSIIYLVLIFIVMLSWGYLIGRFS